MILVLASLLPLMLGPPAVTAHGDTLTFSASLPSGEWHGFELLVRDSLVWRSRETIMINFPHSSTFAFEQRTTRIDGSTQYLGTALAMTRRVVLGADVSLPADSVASRARDDGRRSVVIFARFPGAFSADSIVRVSVGLIMYGGSVK